MAQDAITFIAAMELGQADILGFSIGSFIAQEAGRRISSARSGWFWGYCGVLRACAAAASSAI
jgi:urea transporter